MLTRDKNEERKKGEEINLQWQTGCSHRPPTLTQRYVVLRAGWSSGGSYMFQVSSKSVERFSSCVGSKFVINESIVCRRLLKATLEMFCIKAETYKKAEGRLDTETFETKTASLPTGMWHYNREHIAKTGYVHSTRF